MVVVGPQVLDVKLPLPNDVVELVPVVVRRIGETVLLGLLREPAVRLVDEVDVGGVPRPVVQGQHLERRGRVARRRMDGVTGGGSGHLRPTPTQLRSEWSTVAETRLSHAGDG
ncbi:hypothetical protein GCM10009578_078020 [Streptomyces rhizosphaericus]